LFTIDHSLCSSTFSQTGGSALATFGESGRFLKKAAQKLLLIWAYGSDTSTAQFKKVFSRRFFSKKAAAFLFPLEPIRL
jgi:hypothetical protein